MIPLVSARCLQPPNNNQINRQNRSGICGRFDRALIGLGRGQLNFIVVFGCVFGRDVKPIHPEDEHRRDERPTTVTSR